MSSAAQPVVQLTSTVSQRCRLMLLFNTIGPVSYTHLDVYKRQSLRSAFDGALRHSRHRSCQLCLVQHQGRNRCACSGRKTRGYDVLKLSLIHILVAEEFGFKTEYVSAEVQEAVSEEEDDENDLPDGGAEKGDGIFQMEISGYHTVGGRPSSEEQLHHKGSHGLCEVFTENMRRRGISLEWILLVVPCDKNVVC